MGTQGLQRPAAGHPEQERASASVPDRSWNKYLHRLIASELNLVTRYYDRTIQWLVREDDRGSLLAEVQCAHKQAIQKGGMVPDFSREQDQRTAILINGTFNYHFDIQGALAEIKPRLSRTSRVLLVIYNPYLSWAYKLANRLKIRQGELPSTFITRVDLQNIAKVAGFEIVRQRPVAYCPWRFLGLGDLVNRILPSIPLARWLSLAFIVSLRPLIVQSKLSLSCIIPARNERGNIEDALRRFPDLGCETEIIFVEGHSTDGTWDEIQRVAALYADRFQIQTMRQNGTGKADAVRLGFSHATKDLLVILDADLTMPPEMLARFYEAYCQGYGDFVNGSRLVYPMEGQAMMFLNRLANVFFAKILSWILDVRIGDSLCGTKLLSRADYARVKQWRADFGDFDPFGDFELLFPAAILNLGIVDIPIRYGARTYGETNIRRFRHGLLLFKMTWIGFIRVKLGFGKAIGQRHT